MVLSPRSERIKERWIDTVRSLWFPVQASGHILAAIGKTLEGLGKWDTSTLKDAKKELGNASKDLLQTGDHLLSGIIGTTRELLGGVLEGKSRAIDALNTSPAKAKTRFGKSRRHVYNRVVNLLDAGVNTVGSVAIAWLDLADISIAKTTDLITARTAPRAHGYGKKVGHMLYTTLIEEPFVTWVWEGGIKGESRKKGNKNFSYTKQRRNST